MKSDLKFTHYFRLYSIRIFENKTIVLRSKSSFFEVSFQTLTVRQHVSIVLCPRCVVIVSAAPGNQSRSTAVSSPPGLGVQGRPGPAAEEAPGGRVGATLPGGTGPAPCGLGTGVRCWRQE